MITASALLRWPRARPSSSSATRRLTKRATAGRFHQWARCARLQFRLRPSKALTISREGERHCSIRIDQFPIVR
eukprot:2978313-Lingulodinium_polyedra.AAC.1